MNMRYLQYIQLTYCLFQFITQGAYVLKHMFVKKLHHVRNRRSFVAFQPTHDGDEEVAMPCGAAMALSKCARQQMAVVARLQ